MYMCVYIYIYIYICTHICTYRYTREHYIQREREREREIERERGVCIHGLLVPQCNPLPPLRARAGAWVRERGLQVAPDLICISLSLYIYIYIYICTHINTYT